MATVPYDKDWMVPFIGLPNVFGAENGSGYNSAADLVTKTVDGIDLNQFWTEFQKTVAINNEQRSRIVRLLTFPVTQLIESVPQVSSARFEQASEYGEPRGIRPRTDAFNLGYDFEWYDLAARFTWKFLAEAPATQVEAINAMALEADNILMFEKIMEALYAGNANREADIAGQIVPVYGLYNGDGTIPPKYKKKTFDGTHTHYMTSGATTIEPADLDDLYDNIAEHGYNSENGYSHLLAVTEKEAREIRKFRVETGATWDFVPAQGSPSQFMPVDQQLMGGSQPSAQYQGLNVVGNYGPWLVIKDDLFPEGYVAGIATGGEENLGNPVGLREHANVSLRGLRLVKGPSADYPLIDSFYQRGFGTGIRQRGGSAIMQITAAPTYTAPTSY